MSALVYRFPAARIVRLAPRHGMLTDGTPCKLLAIGCGRVKLERLDERGHVATEWHDAERVLMQEYERTVAGEGGLPARFAEDCRPSDSEPKGAA